MKKIFARLALSALILTGCTSAPADVQPVYESAETLSEVAEEAPPAPEVEEIIPESPVVSITVSAAGDCTLASDVYYMGKGSFVKTYEALEGDSEYFFKNVRHIFENDNLTIVNFEGTLSENGKREDKDYAFRGKPEYVNILTNGSVEAVSLANNHSYDYGEDAYWDTGKILSDNGIVWFDGEDIAIKEINGIKIGLIGANLLESHKRRSFLENLEMLNAQNPDLIIASFHWGVEKSQKPNKIQMEYARLAIDNGADLVIGHHPHILQGIEQYNGKYILYSLGNFCFGGNRHPTDFDTAIFQQTFNFKDGQLIESTNPIVFPCSVSSHKKDNNFQPTPLDGEDFEKVKEKIISRSSDFTGIENVLFESGIQY